MAEWDSLFKPLKVPAQYGRYQNLDDDQEAIKFLATWKNDVYTALNDLNNRVAQARASGELLDDATLANIVFYVLPYAIESDGCGLDLAPWSAPPMQHTAFGMFLRLSPVITLTLL
jgi:hypothetical protein